MRDEQMKALSDRLAAIQAKDMAIRARVAAMRREREESEQLTSPPTEVRGIPGLATARDGEPFPV